MVDRDVVTEKLSTLERCLARIASAKSRADLLDLDRDDIIALNLVRAIQAALDLATHVISTEGYGVPASAADSFRLLAERGTIGTELAERLVRMVGFRNISIHEYRKVDPAIVDTIVAERLGDLRELAARVVDVFGLAADPD